MESYGCILSCHFPMSSTLHCYVNANNIFRKTKFNSPMDQNNIVRMFFFFESVELELIRFADV